MNFFKGLFTIMSVLVLSTLAFSQARAAEGNGGLFLEPGVTYEMLAGGVDYPAPFTNSTGKLQGLGLVARFGIHAAEILFVGLDARYARPNFTDSANDTSSSAVEYNYGPMIGAQMPQVIGLRFWGSYIIGGLTDPDESKGVDVKFNNPTGWRLGAGFKVALVSLNLEYQALTHSSTTLEKIGPFALDSNMDSVKYRNEGFVLSVTFPLAL